MFKTSFARESNAYERVAGSDEDNVWDDNASAELEKEYGNASDDDSDEFDDPEVEMKGLISSRKGNKSNKDEGEFNYPKEVRIYDSNGTDAYSYYPMYYASGLFGKCVIFAISTMVLYSLSFLVFKPVSHHGPAASIETPAHRDDPGNVMEDKSSKKINDYWTDAEFNGEDDRINDDWGNDENEIMKNFMDDKTERDPFEEDDAFEAENGVGDDIFNGMKAELEEEKAQTSYRFDIDDQVTEELFENSGIARIIILGERNTGVPWFYSKVKECFPDVLITGRLSRPSQYFQTKELDGSNTPTLVLPLFLNAYDWVDTMRQNPKFMPNHNNMQDWKSFVTKPWTMGERPIRDVELWNEKNQDPDERMCQFGFTYNEIIPCVMDEDHAEYELQKDGSGDPYSSILELRADKIENFMSIMDWKHVKLLLPIQYETLVEDGGFQYILEHIEQYTTLKKQCDTSSDSFRAPVFWKGHLDQDYIEYMNENVKWDSEYLVGYNVITEKYTEDFEMKEIDRGLPPDKHRKNNKGNWDMYHVSETLEESAHHKKSSDSDADILMEMETETEAETETDPADLIEAQIETPPTMSPKVTMEDEKTAYPSNARISYMPPPEDIQTAEENKGSHNAFAHSDSKSVEERPRHEYDNASLSMEDNKIKEKELEDLSDLAVNAGPNAYYNDDDDDEGVLSSLDPMPEELQDNGV